MVKILAFDDYLMWKYSWNWRNYTTQWWTSYKDNQSCIFHACHLLQKDAALVQLL